MLPLQKHPYTNHYTKLKILCPFRSNGQAGNRGRRGRSLREHQTASFAAASGHWNKPSVWSFTPELELPGSADANGIWTRRSWRLRRRGGKLSRNAKRNFRIWQCNWRRWSNVLLQRGRYKRSSKAGFEGRRRVKTLRSLSLDGTGIFITLF